MKDSFKVADYVLTHLLWDNLASEFYAKALTPAGGDDDVIEIDFDHDSEKGIDSVKNLKAFKEAVTYFKRKATRDE
jgi:hypothetical protein